MARKIGTEFVKDMLDRGRRELGASLYSDSNVAQPMYPLRGGYEPPPKEPQEQRGSILDSRMGEKSAQEYQPSRDDRAMDRG